MHGQPNIKIVRGYYMWNLWWRDSNWGRYLYEQFRFSFVVSRHQHSKTIFVNNQLDSQFFFKYVYFYMRI